MQELELLSGKLAVLLKKYVSLRAENKSLRETIDKQTSSIELLNSKVTLLEEKMTAIKLGNTINDDQEKMLLRKQLDGVIGEIDKILTSLND